MDYPIIEIFDSIQGEGLKIGIPATFIRFAGCNLRCKWCDTKESWDITASMNMNVEEILSKISQKLIVLTGGEPTLYDLSLLIKNIHSLYENENNNRKICIAIETNGTNAIDYDGIDWITCSPKPESDYIIKCEPNELKYVVDDEFSPDVIPKKYAKQDDFPIWLQPNGYDLEKSMQKCYDLAMEHDFLRVGLQLHKIYNIK